MLAGRRYFTDPCYGKRPKDGQEKYAVYRIDAADGEPVPNKVTRVIDDVDTPNGICIAPDNKTLWVTSIPNNAVYVYSLDDLKLIGEVALPSLDLPGHTPISAVPNWVTFTPDSKTIYISNAALRSITAIDTVAKKVKAVIPVGEVPKRINTLVMN